jgi:hypothetical protein
MYGREGEEEEENKPGRKERKNQGLTEEGWKGGREV